MSYPFCFARVREALEGQRRRADVRISHRPILKTLESNDCVGTPSGGMASSITLRASPQTFRKCWYADDGCAPEDAGAIPCSVTTTPGSLGSCHDPIHWRAPCVCAAIAVYAASGLKLPCGAISKK